MAKSEETVFLKSDRKHKILVQAKMLQKWIDIIDRYAEEKGFSRAKCVELLLENCAKEIVNGRIK